jgi:hypothetical protein
MVRVLPKSVVRREALVASRAERILFRGLERTQGGCGIRRVGIVAVDTRQLRGTGAEHHVACFSRVDVTPSRRALARTTLPGGIVPGEEHLMASDADAIQSGCACTSIFRQPHSKGSAHRLERRQVRGVSDVLGRAEMTRFAPDPHFDEVMGTKT